MRRPTLLLSILLVACGGSAPPAGSAAPAPSSAVKTTAAPDPLPTSSMRRSEVARVVKKGLGAFLQRVELDEQPVMEAGKFKGFRIRALRGDGWKGVDLMPGDVVMRVNGFSVERPDTALEAFRSLEVASELRVDYERQGAVRSLRYSIIDDTRP
jgi:type II secretory pathway component PulC